MPDADTPARTKSNRLGFTENVIALRGEPKEGVSTMNSTVEWPMVEIGRYIYAISTSGGAVLHLLDTMGSRLAQIRFSEGGALAARAAARPPDSGENSGGGRGRGPLRDLRWWFKHLASYLFLSTISPHSKCPTVFLRY